MKNGSVDRFIQSDENYVMLRGTENKVPEKKRKNMCKMLRFFAFSLYFLAVVCFQCFLGSFVFSIFFSLLRNPYFSLSSKCLDIGHRRTRHQTHFRMTRWKQLCFFWRPSKTILILHNTVNNIF